MNEYAVGADRDAVRGLKVSDGERLHSLGAVDPRLGVNGAEPSPRFIAKRQGAGHGRTARLVGGGAEDVIEKQGAYSSVHMACGTFVGRAQRYIGPDASVGFMVDHHRGRQGIA